MQAEELLKYIKNPSLLEKKDIGELQKLVKDFPYFQSAHLLLSLASKKWDASVYQQSLKKTAIVVTNRNHLYKLIHELDKQEVKENALVEAEVAETTLTVVNNEKETKQPLVSEVKQQQDEDLKTEITILKETEVTAEELEHQQMDEKQGVATKEEVVTEEDIEIEIEKSLVNSYVEKEVLKTNELFKPELRGDTPENFGDWLKFLKKNNGQTYDEIEVEVNKEKEKQKQKEVEKVKSAQKSKQKRRDIIDKIIETNPGPIRHKEEQKFFKSDFKARESLLENEHLVTETLAKIYAIQGNINKAIRAYEILSLKFPQKSAYFATLIEKLKSNQ